MQGRKIMLKGTGEVFTFLQVIVHNDMSICVVEDENGNIRDFESVSMQFVKEEPTFKLDTTDFNLKIKKLTEESKEYQEYLDFKKLRDENMFKVQPSPFFDKNKVTCGIEDFKSETTGIDMMKYKSESTTNDFLEKLKAKIDSMSQEELNASWEAVKDNGKNKVYLTYLEPKAEPFPTYRESMPTLQNTVEVWACMDENGFIKISSKNNFYKHGDSWHDNVNLFPFKDIQWEDEKPKRFRITVEPLGNK